VDAEQYTDQRVLVVGGGDSAVEAAMACGDAGATVHLCYRKGAFSRIKKKNQARLERSVASGAVQLLLYGNPREIREKTVLIEVAGEMVELENDYVIVAVGGVLPTKFLEAAGVEVSTYRGEVFAPAN